MCDFWSQRFSCPERVENRSGAKVVVCERGHASHTREKPFGWPSLNGPLAAYDRDVCSEPWLVLERGFLGTRWNGPGDSDPAVSEADSLYAGIGRVESDADEPSEPREPVVAQGISMPEKLNPIERVNVEHEDYLDFGGRLAKLHLTITCNGTIFLGRWHAARPSCTHLVVRREHCCCSC